MAEKTGLIKERLVLCVVRIRGGMLFKVKLILFIIAMVGIVWVSRSSLWNFRSHGFYRFFAWVIILCMIWMNIEFWFYEPFRLHQIISWILLIISLPFLIWGVQLLRKAGKSDVGRTDPTLVGFEKTTELVTEGIYSYIRHPLYSSLLFLAWGTFFKMPSWVGGCLAVIASFFLTMTAKVEEAENINFFGDSYRQYMKQSKMFIPFLF